MTEAGRGYGSSLKYFHPALQNSIPIVENEEMISITAALLSFKDYVALWAS